MECAVCMWDIQKLKADVWRNISVYSLLLVQKMWTDSGHSSFKNILLYFVEGLVTNINSHTIFCSTGVILLKIVNGSKNVWKNHYTVFLPPMK